jgi:hypothetical protein
LIVDVVDVDDVVDVVVDERQIMSIIAMITCTV